MKNRFIGPSLISKITRILAMCLGILCCNIARAQFTFTETTYAVPNIGGGDFSNGSTIKSADFNHDGWTDIALVNGKLMVMLGTGNGTFAPTDFYSILPTGDGAYNLAFGDFNKDGHIDIVVSPFNAYYYSIGAVIFYGTGTGTFSPASALASPHTGSSIVQVADLNNDGHDDVLALYYLYRYIHLGTGSGTFNSSYASAAIAYNNIISIKDINNDGFLDYSSKGNGYGTVTIQLGEGTGAFTTVFTFDTGASGNAFLEDMDGDNIVDLVAQQQYAIAIFKGNGDGTFQTAPFAGLVPTSNIQINDVKVADINNDSKKDILITHYRSAGTSRTFILAYLGDGTGGFGSETFLAASQPVTYDDYIKFDVADLNNDGKLDFSIKGQNDKVWVLLNTTPQPPSIASFMPVSGPSGTTVTITGTNFTGATAVSFGGTAAASFNVQSATTITAVVGTGTSGDIVVTTPGGTATLAGFIFIQDQTITFAPLGDKTFGDAPFTLSATASSSLAVSYASSNTAVATVSGNDVTIVGAGSTIITASQAGNTNYSAATNVPQTLTVNQASQLPNVYVTTPANGSVNQNAALNVTARAVTGATVYTLELSTDSNFSNPIIRTGARTQNFDLLQYNTTYYTQVKTDLRADYGQVTTFTTRTAESLAYVTAPANNAVNTNTAISITSNPVLYASSYTIQLSETADFATVAFEVTGPTRALAFTGLKYGTTYYNRVKTDLSAVFGEVRSFTTRLAESLAYVTAPAINAINVKTVLNISSNAVTGASLYTIQLSESADFATIAFEVSGSTRTLAFSGLKYNAVYFNRVRTDLSPAFGQVRSFTTPTPESITYVTNPVNNAVGRNANLNVCANTVLGAIEYTIQLSESPDFSTIDFEVTGPTRTLAFNGLKYSTTYYNRVRTDLSSQFGEVRSFTTRSAEGLAYVSSPANGAIDQAVNLNISSNTVPNATQYIIQLSETNDFSTIAFEVTGPTRTLAFSGLKYNTTYFNRVITNAEVTFDYGPVRSFSTRTAESISYVTIPANNAVNVNNTTLNITANTVPGASTYTIQLSESPVFTTVDFEVTGPTRTLAFANLKYNTTYYNRVRTDQSTIYGQVRSFTTRTAESLAYVTNPANGAVNRATALSITANTVPGATSYTIQLSEASDFSAIAFEVMGPTHTLAFSGLITGTTYYNRVLTDLTSVYGPVRSFTTQGVRPSGARITADTKPTVTEPSLEVKEFEVSVYPNPFREKLTFYIESVDQQAEVALTDFNGRNIHQSTEKTNQTIQIIKEFSSGAYLLRIRTEHYNETIRVVRIE